MSKKGSTMQDVANLAEVSKTTVSHVINETRHVSEDLRKRVLFAMDELRYQPNILARSLRRKETCTIGLIVPNVANPYYAEVSKGVEDVSFNANYNLILCNSDKDLQKEIQYTNLLIRKRVDGILFVGAWIGNQTKHLLNAYEQDIPVGVVDRNITEKDFDVVVVDNVLGGWLAASHLFGLGHKRIGCIGGIPEFTPNADRVRGYTKALQELGVPIDNDLIQKTDFEFEGGYKATQKLLSLDDRPTAIFACNDLMAIGAIRSALDLGYRVPEDISVVGFDDIKMATYSNPQLTTIAQPMYEMGKQAAKMLLDRICDLSTPQKRRILEPKLIVRNSTAKYLV